jgi:hypothetical protein
MILQPVHQWSIIRQSPHQRHRGVRMKVDQSGNQYVVIQGDMVAWHIAYARFNGRQDGKDAAAVDGDCVVLNTTSGSTAAIQRASISRSII